MKFLQFLAPLLLFSAYISNAQHNHNWCGHDEMQQELMDNDEDYAADLEQLNQILSAPAPEGEQSTLRIIPVVFHVVYATEADNISKAQILDGLRVLNEDFRKLNADTSTIRNIFRNDAADIEIEFRLATKDPNGNCTDGITRTQDNESLTGDNDVKNVINWDNSRYYNIWVTRRVLGTSRGPGQRTVLGYSYFPRPGGNSFRQDGTVIRHDELGSIGTSIADGRTLTHETGHYLALYHPFQSQQGSSNGCIGPGDFVSDTPPAQLENFGCDYNTNSCTSDNLPDMIENHMDYSSCAVMFTNGQKARMVNSVTNSSLRGGMVSTGNLNFTGVNNPLVCAPEAKFEAERRFVCTNEPIQFFDRSEEGPATSWNWTVNTPTQQTSTVQNPTFTFTQPGVYDVSLQASNASGSNSTTETEYIYVKNADSPFFDKLWVQSFENPTIPFTVTPVDVGGDGTTFEVFTNAGSHQSQSLILRNNALYTGEIDELISPAISTQGAGSDLTLFFDYAFAARTSGDDDVLEVYASRDCGETWIRRRFYRNNRLTTAPNTFNNFVPNAQQWTTESINFGAYVQNDPILIKFVFENGGGNNFYIDNIRFGEGPDVGVDEFTARTDLELYPNPNNGSFTLKASGQADEVLQLSILDVSGKRVYEQSLTLENGSLETKLQLNLKPGVYVLNLAGADGQSTERLVIK